VSSVVLAVAGSGPDDELHSYQTLVSSLGIESRVHFLGAVRHEEVAHLMNAATVFVLPSHQEPFGLVLLEALACGCPVVATDEGGPSRFIPKDLQECGDALLIQSLANENPDSADGDRFVEELAGAIARQLSRPLTYERRIAIASHVGNLTWREYVERLRSVYAQASARPGPEAGRLTNSWLSGPEEVQ
jgi:glycosyltransferase involved in cell wall biosynthesis